MKLNMRRCLEIHQALRTVGDKVFPIQIKMRLAKLTRKIREEVQDFEPHRTELVRKYGAFDPVKKDWDVKPDQFPEFEAEVKKLLDEETEINFSPLIPEKELEKANVSSNEMSLMLDLIEGGIDAAKEEPQKAE